MPPVPDEPPQEAGRPLDYERRRAPVRWWGERSGRERMAWLVFMVVLAAMSLRLAGGVAPSDRDLEFVRLLVEVKQQIDRQYVYPVDDRVLREAAVQGMLKRLDDFSEYIPPDAREAFEMEIVGRFYGVGILAEPAREPGGGMVVVMPIPDSPAMAAGVLAGDRIVAVDGRDITALAQQQILEHIRGPLGTTVTLTVERGRERDLERLDLSMPRAAVRVPILEGYGRHADGTPRFLLEPDEPFRLGYVRFVQFTEGSAAELARELNSLLEHGMDGLVLDLRFNNGGLLSEAIAVVDLFIGGGVIVASEGEHSPRRTWRAHAEGTLPHFPMVILVNEFSASAAEVAAGALQDHERATVVGERTYGKGSVQDVPRLSDGGQLRLTTAHYFLPGGRRVHREPEADVWGVDPDVRVEVDITDPAVVGDRNGPLVPLQVEAAIDVLLAKLASRAADRGREGEIVPPLEADHHPPPPPPVEPEDEAEG